ncbi:MAG: biopolymer transporter ExbD [Chakrabartia sp.]
MAMSVGGEGGEEAPMSAINTTPLVDVMLVLLIIFLIAIPVVNKTIEVKLPVLAYQPTVSKAENMLLSVRGDAAGNCEVYLGLTRMRANELLTVAAKRFKAESDRLGPEATDPDLFPEVHIRGDQQTPYKCVGGVVSIMQSAGFIRVGFISSPVDI